MTYNKITWSLEKTSSNRLDKDLPNKGKELSIMRGITAEGLQTTPPNTAIPANLKLFTREGWARGQIPQAGILTGIRSDHMSRTMSRVS